MPGPGRDRGTRVEGEVGELAVDDLRLPIPHVPHSPVEGKFNGAAHRSKQQRESLVYVYPKEGLSFWNDNFMVPKGAPNLENAKTFINWMMAPENIAIASNYTGYMNAVRGSSEFMDESLVEDPAVNMPEEYADRLRPTEDCSVKARELRNRVWTRLRS